MSNDAHWERTGYNRLLDAYHSRLSTRDITLPSENGSPSIYYLLLTLAVAPPPTREPVRKEVLNGRLCSVDQTPSRTGMEGRPSSGALNSVPHGIETQRHGIAAFPTRVQLHQPLTDDRANTELLLY